MSFPIYSGKGEWCVFWVQFERLARRFQWSEEAALDCLIYCLRDDALEHYAGENMEVRSDYGLLVSSPKRRFGDRTPHETYRASLQTLKKLQKETLEEYAARVRRLVNKAYPGIVGKPLLEDIAVEHLVNGLSDHNPIYDVMTKKPSTVEAAPDLIQWHENCHSIQRKKTGIRQLKTEQDSKKTDWVSARWMGNCLWLKSA